MTIFTALQQQYWPALAQYYNEVLNQLDAAIQQGPGTDPHQAGGSKAGFLLMNTQQWAYNSQEITVLLPPIDRVLGQAMLLNRHFLEYSMDLQQMCWPTCML